MIPLDGGHVAVAAGLARLDGADLLDHVEARRDLAEDAVPGLVEVGRVIDGVDVELGRGAVHVAGALAALGGPHHELALSSLRAMLASPRTDRPALPGLKVRDRRD